MKKSVLALAALGAFAGAASAQSSVTMFGVVDLNVMTVNNQDRTYAMGSDGMASSRLGFRGTEDLGGGLKAGFWLEMGIAPDTGKSTTATSWGNNANPATGGELFFNRRSTVSLSNQWGELRLGRDYAPSYWNWANFDPFGNVGVGSAANLALGSNAQQQLAGTTYGTLVRVNNMVQYILPNGQFGPGLYGQVGIAPGEGAAGNKYWGGRIGYAAGPFDVAGAYGKSECLNAACTVDLTVWNIAGSWNFGFMKLSGFYGSTEADGLLTLTGTTFKNNKATRDNWYVAVVAPFGQWNVKASYGGTNGKDAVDKVDAAQWALGADYNLSKRTALYATWSSINNDNATFSVAPTAAPAITKPGTNSTGGQVGIRHTF